MEKKASSLNDPHAPPKWIAVTGQWHREIAFYTYQKDTEIRKVLYVHAPQPFNADVWIPYDFDEFVIKGEVWKCHLIFWMDDSKSHYSLVGNPDATETGSWYMWYGPATHQALQVGCPADPTGPMPGQTDGSVPNSCITRNRAFKEKYADLAYGGDSWPSKKWGMQFHRGDTPPELTAEPAPLDPAPPGPDSPTPPPPTLKDSEFKRLYAEATSPEKGYTIQDLREALRHFCAQLATDLSLGAAGTSAANFATEIEQPSRLRRMLSRKLSSLSASEALTKFAVRIWTSDQRWHGREFCSYLNQTIREDGRSGQSSMEALRYAAILCRAINQVLQRQNEMAKQIYIWPKGPSGSGSHEISEEENTTYRGGGIMRQHRDFFTIGKHFRTSMYTATSFYRDTALRFALQLRSPKESTQPILWTIRLPAEGCLHVNYVESLTKVKGETEFLFPPYSVFTVEQVEWSDSPNPSRVTLRAARDNRAEPDDLPTTPWC